MAGWKITELIDCWLNSRRFTVCGCLMHRLRITDSLSAMLVILLGGVGQTFCYIVWMHSQQFVARSKCLKLAVLHLPKLRNRACMKSILKSWFAVCAARAFAERNSIRRGLATWLYNIYIYIYNYIFWESMTYNDVQNWAAECADILQNIADQIAETTHGWLRFRRDEDYQISRSKMCSLIPADYRWFGNRVPPKSQIDRWSPSKMAMKWCHDLG